MLQTCLILIRSNQKMNIAKYVKTSINAGGFKLLKKIQTQQFCLSSKIKLTQIFCIYYL